MTYQPLHRGTHFYIQRSTSQEVGESGELEPVWADCMFMNEQTGKLELWRSGRFKSATAQIAAWKADETDEDGITYRILQRTFRERVIPEFKPQPLDIVELEDDVIPDVAGDMATALAAADEDHEATDEGTCCFPHRQKWLAKQMFQVD